MNKLAVIELLVSVLVMLISLWRLIRYRITFRLLSTKGVENNATIFNRAIENGSCYILYKFDVEGKTF
jgi:hypothetical protein